MKPYSIVLADDHILLRQGLRKILGEIPGTEVAGEAGNGEELLEVLSRCQPDLVLLDISMPKLGGLEALGRIKTSYPNVKVLILTMHKDKDYLHRAVSAGANGYLLKEDADLELFSAIEKIRQGRTYVSALLADDLADQWAENLRGGVSGEDKLTSREKEVLVLIADGNSNKEIADILSLSPRTVERHRGSIMHKLGLKGIVNLVRFAVSRGYHK